MDKLDLFEISQIHDKEHELIKHVFICKCGTTRKVRASSKTWFEIECDVCIDTYCVNPQLK